MFILGSYRKPSRCWVSIANILAWYLCFHLRQDDGTVTVLKVLADINYIKYDEVSVLVSPTYYMIWKSQVASNKIHEKRVMGIYIDSTSGLCYSVSEDKKFRVFEYAKNDVISGNIAL